MNWAARISKLEKIDSAEMIGLLQECQNSIEQDGTEDEWKAHARWLCAPYWNGDECALTPADVTDRYDECRLAMLELGKPKPEDAELLKSLRSKIPDEIAEKYLYVLKRWEAPHTDLDWLKGTA